MNTLEHVARECTSTEPHSAQMVGLLLMPAAVDGTVLDHRCFGSSWGDDPATQANNSPMSSAELLTDSGVFIANMLASDCKYGPFSGGVGHVHADWRTPLDRAFGLGESPSPGAGGVASTRAALLETHRTSYVLHHLHNMMSTFGLRGTVLDLPGSGSAGDGGRATGAGDDTPNTDDIKSKVQRTAEESSPQLDQILSYMRGQYSDRFLALLPHQKALSEAALHGGVALEALLPPSPVVMRPGIVPGSTVLAVVIAVNLEATDGKAAKPLLDEAHVQREIGRFCATSMPDALAGMTDCVSTITLDLSAFVTATDIEDAVYYTETGIGFDAATAVEAAMQRAFRDSTAQQALIAQLQGWEAARDAGVRVHWNDKLGRWTVQHMFRSAVPDVVDGQSEVHMEPPQLLPLLLVSGLPDSLPQGTREGANRVVDVPLAITTGDNCAASQLIPVEYRGFKAWQPAGIRMMIPSATVLQPSVGVIHAVDRAADGSHNILPFEGRSEGLRQPHPGKTWFQQQVAAGIVLAGTSSPAPYLRWDGTRGQYRVDYRWAHGRHVFPPYGTAIHTISSVGSRADEDQSLYYV